MQSQDYLTGVVSISGISVMAPSFFVNVADYLQPRTSPTDCDDWYRARTKTCCTTALLNSGNAGGRLESGTIPNRRDEG